MSKKSAAKVFRQVAKAGKQPAGSNSGIFSNSGFGQKVDNRAPKSTTQTYATVPGAHKKLRAELLARVPKAVLPNPIVKAATKAAKKDSNNG